MGQMDSTSDRPAANRMARRYSAEVVEHRRNLSEKRRKAFQAFLDKYNFTAASLARACGMPTANTFYNFVNGHTAMLSDETMDLIVQSVPGSTLAELTGERHAPKRTARRSATETVAFRSALKTVLEALQRDGQPMEPAA